MHAKIKILRVRSCPYSVTKRPSNEPTRIQALTMPLRTRIATLSMPSVENRLAASCASAALGEAGILVIAANRRTSETRPPIQAAAAKRCRTSATRCTYPNVCGVDPACPVQAINAIRATAAPKASPRHHAERSKTRHIASTIARAKRICDIHPNCVKLITSRSAPEVIASPTPSSLNDIVSKSSQTSAEITATARLIQATFRVCVRNGFAAASCAFKVGSATTARNTTVPVTIAVAAKCIARVAIMAPLSAAPKSIRRPLRLLADLESKIAVGRMGVHRKHPPVHVMGARAGGPQRHRHLGAADPGL